MHHDIAYGEQLLTNFYIIQIGETTS